MKLQKLIGYFAWEVWDYIKYPHWHTPSWIIRWTLKGIRER